MAEEISACEAYLDIQSLCLDGENPAEIPAGLDADVHVVHTHLPDIISPRTKKVVWIAHGTPEVMFTNSVMEGIRHQQGASDYWMSAHHHISTATAIVTFWERHAWIWKGMANRSTVVDTVPMGVNRALWNRVASRGKFVGAPSILTGENCFSCKWPLDLFFAMPDVFERHPLARLHVFSVPTDQCPWWYTLLYSNGTAYRSYIAPIRFELPDLCNAFVSVDYYIGLVRYGDHNRMMLEAKRCGCPVISYRGNPYADYWIDEGDQRTIAAQLTMILSGQVPPREVTPVPDITETAAAMSKIYERIL
jgi:hypothetical protein